MRALIPSLTIQPLLENAIYHGIEQLPEGGEVRVFGTKNNDNLEIRIENPVARGRTGKTDGNKMALSNIRQRFKLAYDGDATVEMQESEESYSVRLVFPCQEEQP